MIPNNRKCFFYHFFCLCLCGMLTTQMGVIKVEAEEAQTAVSVQLTKIISPGDVPNNSKPQPPVTEETTDNQQTSTLGTVQGMKKPVKVVLTTSSFLPRTGEKKNSWLIGLGCLFVGMGVVFLRQRKEGSKDESL